LADQGASVDLHVGSLAHFIVQEKKGPRQRSTLLRNRMRLI